VPALEPLRGIRIVASEDAIDGRRWQGDHALALRLAPDEVFVLGADAVHVFENGAIDDLETGFVGAWLGTSDVEAVRGHIEWILPGDRPALAQGKVAGVPARLWLGEDGRTLLLTHAAYAHDLEERLGWR
jgi:hypothetical protein